MEATLNTFVLYGPQHSLSASKLRPQQGNDLLTMTLDNIDPHTTVIQNVSHIPHSTHFIKIHSLVRYPVPTTITDTYKHVTHVEIKGFVDNIRKFCHFFTFFPRLDKIVFGHSAMFDGNLDQAFQDNSPPGPITQCPSIKRVQLNNDAARIIAATGYKKTQMSQRMQQLTEFILKLCPNLYVLGYTSVPGIDLSMFDNRFEALVTPPEGHMNGQMFLHPTGTQPQQLPMIRNVRHCSGDSGLSSPPELSRQPDGIEPSPLIDISEVEDDDDDCVILEENGAENMRPALPPRAPLVLLPNALEGNESDDSASTSRTSNGRRGRRHRERSPSVLPYRNRGNGQPRNFADHRKRF